jgi:hypothetical protein
MSRTPQKTPFRFPVLLGLAALGLAPTPGAEPSPTIQFRIDALLKHRLKPEPLPVNPPNPFQMISGSRREFSPEDLGSKPAVSDELVASSAPSEQAPPKELAGNSQAEVLIGSATKLKLGGIIILKDQLQIVVNGVPRKEGDSIAADWNNTIVYFKIARLLPGHMVLRYGDAEATVKF